MYSTCMQIVFTHQHFVCCMDTSEPLQRVACTFNKVTVLHCKNASDLFVTYWCCSINHSVFLFIYRGTITFSSSNGYSNITNHPSVVSLYFWVNVGGEIEEPAVTFHDILTLVNLYIYIVCNSNHLCKTYL